MFRLLIVIATAFVCTHAYIFEEASLNFTSCTGNLVTQFQSLSTDATVEEIQRFALATSGIFDELHKLGEAHYESNPAEDEEAEDYDEDSSDDDAAFNFDISLKDIVDNIQGAWEHLTQESPVTDVSLDNFDDAIATARQQFAVVAEKEYNLLAKLQASCETA